MNDRELAEKIAEVSALSFDKALRALEAGGLTRELAISIYETEKSYAEINARIAASKKKLAETISP